MAQIIQTICDVCQEEHKQVAGEPFRINDVVVDLCAEHIRTMTLWAIIDLIEQGHIGARTADVREAEGPACKFGCNKGKPFKSMQGLRQHMSRSHKELVADMGD